MQGDTNIIIADGMIMKI